MERFSFKILAARQIVIVTATQLWSVVNEQQKKGAKNNGARLH